MKNSSCALGQSWHSAQSSALLATEECVWVLQIVCEVPPAPDDQAGTYEVAVTFDGMRLVLYGFQYTIENFPRTIINFRSG
jgi:hypothetical protein